MKINNKKGVINKHFLNSLMLFLAVLIIALTFISFLEDAQKKDKSFSINNIENKAQINKK
jgi:hypothetical protein